MNYTYEFDLPEFPEQAVNHAIRQRWAREQHRNCLHHTYRGFYRAYRILIERNRHGGVQPLLIRQHIMEPEPPLEWRILNAGGTFENTYLRNRSDVQANPGEDDRGRRGWKDILLDPRTSFCVIAIGAFVYWNIKRAQ